MFTLSKLNKYAVLFPVTSFLIAEDGTGREDANSYASVSFANNYLRFTPFASVWNNLSQMEKEVALIFATDLMDQRATYRGRKVYPNANLKFPRTGLYDCEGNPIAADIVPNAIKKAVALVAAHYSNPAVNPYINSGKLGLTEITADVVTLRFQEGFNATTANAPVNINPVLDCLGHVSFGRSNFVPINRVI